MELDNVKKVIRDLGSNYNSDDYVVINDIYNEMSSVASNLSKLKQNDARLYPFVKKATKSIYLARGSEGMKSRSEGSISSSYEDIVERLKADITQAGLRRVY